MTHKIDYLETRFSFTSGTGEIESGRYITEYNVGIYAYIVDENLDEQATILIGKAKLILLLLELADNDEYPYRYIFDSSMTLSDLGSVIFDWEINVLKDKFDNFASASFNSNILYIDQIEILPNYRSLGFGKKIIKDILCRFCGCFGTMILQSFPMQFKGKKEPEWDILMEYETLEKDKKNAARKLNEFYKSLGFKKLFEDDYFFYNSALKNNKLDKININQ